MSEHILQGETNNEKAHDLLNIILKIGRAVNHNFLIQHLIYDLNSEDMFHTEVGITMLLTRMEKEGALRRLTMPEGVLWGVVKTEFELNN